ncbi:MAG TPA: hypothetical protein VMJ32_11360 [Pirellulales bacterium]|nr:hypothetical protein [Pirellulales bacterium]
MREEPPAALTDLLARLHLATPQQVAEVRGRARKLSRDLPLFDSVWIDALAQARLLTPYQAAEINAGRGEQLRVGPYVLRRRIQRLDFAECFLATTTDGGEKSKSKPAAELQLLVARGWEAAHAKQAAANLQAVAERLKEIQTPGIIPLQEAGHAGNALWAAYEPPPGFLLEQWLPCHGRLPPAAAWEVARQMVASLAALEKSGLVHGEIAASALWVTGAGQVQLARCGVRSAWRGHELSIADEMLGCGCLWWHLLAGREPFVIGRGASKLQGAQHGALANIRKIAPDVSGVLATAIGRCTQHDPAQRPQSFSELEALLGAPTTAGRRLLAWELAGGAGQTNRTPWLRRAQSTVQRSAQPLLAATACALLLAAATWPLWRARRVVNEPGQVNATTVTDGFHRNSDVSGGLLKGVASGQAHFASNDSPILGNTGTSNANQDRTIRQASYEADDKGAGQKPASNSPDRPILELSSTTETAASALRLQPDTIVRGKNKGRPRLMMPPNGMVLSADHVRFEDVDFVWRQRPEEITSPDRHAVVDLQAAEAEFAGCTFQTLAVGTFELPAAIRISDKPGHRAALAPAVHVQLSGCVIQGVACGVDCQARGPAEIEMHNTLYLGSGPLVRFPQARRADAPTAVTLEHVTVRGAAAVLELHGDDLDDACGSVMLNTTTCVLAPADSGALVVFAGRHWPKSAGGTLAALDWNGQDSLALAAMPTVMWQHDATHEPLPDEALPVEGLVASPFDFAGPPSGEPGDSRLRHWLAPGKTDLPPGIGDGLPRVPN